MEVLEIIRPFIDKKLALMDLPMDRESCRQCGRKIGGDHVGRRDQHDRPVCVRCEISMVRSKLTYHRKGVNVLAARLKRLEARL